MIYVLMKILLGEVKEWSSNDISLLTSRVHIYRLSHSAFRRTLRSLQITKQQQKKQQHQMCALSVSEFRRCYSEQ